MIWNWQNENWLQSHPFLRWIRKVIILDEPTIAQDWKGRKIIQKMIRDLSSQGKTVIAILHDMDFVAESFERVIVMAHGKVLADGTKKRKCLHRRVFWSRQGLTSRI